MFELTLAGLIYHIWAAFFAIKCKLKTLLAIDGDHTETNRFILAKALIHFLLSVG